MSKLAPADEKNATLSLHLIADSSYDAQEEHRISANQWRDILLVAHQDALATALRERDETRAVFDEALDDIARQTEAIGKLKAALRGLLAWHSDEGSTTLDDLIEAADEALGSVE